MNQADAVLQTDRLLLEPLLESDAGLMLEVWNDPAFIRHVGDRGIRTLDEATRVLREGALKQWEELGYGPYRVSLGGGEAIGICGLLKRPNLDDPDIGYALLEPFRGHGYASEAARAVRDHARDSMGLQKILAIVSPEHGRSIRLLEKLGMMKKGSIRMPDEDEDIFLFEMRFG